MKNSIRNYSNGEVNIARKPAKALLKYENIRAKNKEGRETHNYKLCVMLKNTATPNVAAYSQLTKPIKSQLLTLIFET